MSITGVPSMQSRESTSSIPPSFLHRSLTTLTERGFGREGDRRENTPLRGRSSDIFRALAVSRSRSPRCIQARSIRCELVSTPSRAGTNSGKISICPLTPWTGIIRLSCTGEWTTPTGVSTSELSISRFPFPCTLCVPLCEVDCRGEVRLLSHNKPGCHNPHRWCPP